MKKKKKKKIKGQTGNRLSRNLLHSQMNHWKTCSNFLRRVKGTWIMKYSVASASRASLATPMGFSSTGSITCVTLCLTNSYGRTRHTAASSAFISSPATKASWQLIIPRFIFEQKTNFLCNLAIINIFVKGVY